MAPVPNRGHASTRTSLGHFAREPRRSWLTNPQVSLTIAACRPEQVAMDGSRVLVGAIWRPIPPAARQALVAQHLYRLAGKLDPGAGYLSDSRKDYALAPRSVAIKLDRISKGTGIALRAPRTRLPRQ